MRTLWPVLSLLVVPSGAAAQPTGCFVTVDRMSIEITAPIEGADRPGLRERLSAWPGRVWNDAWGAPRTCDSETTITFLAALEGFDPDEARPYCLAPLPEDDGYLLVPGARNFRGLCSRTVCDRINLAAADVAAVAAVALDFIDRDTGEIDGTRNGSGALLLSGTNLALAGALDSTSAELAATLATPAGAVTLMAVGGLLYYCDG